MSKCEPNRQLHFAEAYVSCGGNASEAARLAGYSKTSARQIGGRLARDAKVQRLIRQEQQRVIGGRLCSQALGVLEAIMLDPAAPAGARVDACKTVLDRGGLPAIPANMIVSDGMAGERALADMSLEDVQAFIVEGRARLAAMKAKSDEAVTTQNLTTN
jgi:hypothetical protein